MLRPLVVDLAASTSQSDCCIVHAAQKLREYLCPTFSLDTPSSSLRSMKLKSEKAEKVETEAGGVRTSSGGTVSPNVRVSFSTRLRRRSATLGLMVAIVASVDVGEGGVWVCWATGAGAETVGVVDTGWDSMGENGRGESESGL